jgi:hypothetical protein
MEARISSFCLVFVEKILQGHSKLFMDFIYLINGRLRIFLNLNGSANNYMHGRWERDWCPAFECASRPSRIINVR